MLSVKSIISKNQGIWIKLFISLCLIHPAAHGLYLENTNLNILKNTRIAYYPGSFDPLQLGHISVVNTVLDKGLADYVLIYALPDSDSSKKRVPFLTRFSMLERIYAKHPKVLITKLMPGDMQERLAAFFNDIKFSVVVGSDIINTYIKTSQYDSIWMQGLSIKGTKPEHALSSTGAIMAIPATHVIAAKREGDDLSHLKGYYKNRPITILTTKKYSDISSTQARQIVKKGGSLHDIVPFEVEKIINENKLYKD